MRKNYHFHISTQLFLLVFLITSSIKAQSPSQEGQWGDIIPFPIVPVAAANLPDGNLLTWSSYDRDRYTGGNGAGLTFTSIYDPSSPTNGSNPSEMQVSNTGHDMFCPGINNLANGDILVAGGSSAEETSIYNVLTQSWERGDVMNIPRGYQGNVTLSNGSVFTLGGSWTEDGAFEDGLDRNGELWTEETGWFELPGVPVGPIAENNNDPQGIFRDDNHAWLWPASNGKIFHAGPSKEMYWIDVNANGGQGSITYSRDRDDDTYSMKGTTVMYEPDKLFKLGGAVSYDSGDPANNNAYTIDISNENNVVVTKVTDNNHARTMHNSTLLPDGKIFVTGGLATANTFWDTGAVYQGEIYDPYTDTWSTTASMTQPRTYHSVAILLNDGRVFVGGGGLCGTCEPYDGENHPDAEIYSPPYLFDAGGNLAARPSITAAPTEADWDENITVATDVNVTSFSLIRFSSATHSTNNEQRRIPLATVSGTSHTLTMPSQNNAPPGLYMLFAMDANGVPSVSQTIQIGEASALPNNPNLVAHFEFEEGSGAAAADSSGNNNDATIREHDNGGNPIPLSQNYLGAPGIFGEALIMDGSEFDSNSILDIPYSPSLEDTMDEITVMGWVYRNENGFNTGILAHDYPAMFFGFHNALYKWEFITSNGQLSCYAGYVPANTWVHIAATFDGNVAKLYANGKEVCSKTLPPGTTFDFDNTKSFTGSGFYEQRTPGAEGLPTRYNGSGITDEIDGRIDELKIFRKALGIGAIENEFQAGLASGVAGLIACTPDAIISTYSINDGAVQEGEYVVVSEGEELVISANTASATYYITPPSANENTRVTVPEGSSSSPNIDPGALTLSNIQASDSGRYVLTTAEGCMSFINVFVSGFCDVADGDTPIRAEWSTDGGQTYFEGAPLETVDVTAQQGDEVRLSIQDNGIPFTIMFEGNEVYDGGTDYRILSALPSHSGSYFMESNEGCSVTINLTVEPVVCDETTIRAEWSLNGGGEYFEASDEQPVTINAFTGDHVLLSMVPNEFDFTITHDGITVYSGGGDFDLDFVSPSDSGDYIITSAPGCTTTITLNVTDVACDATAIRAQWSLDGGQSYFEAPDEQPITINANTGNNVRLSMVPDGIDFTVTLEGEEVFIGTTDYILGVIAPSNSGDYIITSSQGCSTTITLNVTDVVCDGDAIRAQWSLNNGQTYEEAPDEQPITVAAVTGDNVRLGMEPDGVIFTVTLDGNQVYDGQGDYLLGVVDPSDTGDYTISSAEGCTTTITLNVTDAACTADDIRAEWSIDGGATYSEAPDEQPVTVTVDTGDNVLISMLPNGVDFTITYDGAEVYNGGTDYSLGAVDISNSGDYIITSSQGCSTTLTLNVNCPSGPFTPEYTLDGTAASGDATITVDEGTPVILGTIEDNVAFTISGPNGASSNGDLDLGNITLSQAGDYIFTSEEGCTATLSINVGDPCAPENFTPQYTVDGVAASGDTTVNVTEGTPVIFGLVQTGINFTITRPDTSVNDGPLNLGNVLLEDAGDYIFTSNAGCTAQITLVVEEACPEGTFTPQYSINGHVGSGNTTINVTEGAQVLLDIVQTGIDFTITGPDGTINNGPLDLGEVSLAQVGNYVFTSEDDCTAQLTLVVEEACQDGTFTPQYTIDGNVGSGDGVITVVEGSTVVLDLVQTDTNYTITQPDANVNNGPLDLGTVSMVQGGHYIFTSEAGCTTQLTIIVEEDGTEPDPDATLEDIKVFPNPTFDGKISFDLSNYMDEIIYVSFYDIYGKLVLQNILPANHDTLPEIDVSILSQGMYMVEIARSNKDENTIKKMIKLR